MVFAKGILNINASVGLNVDDFNMLNFSYEVKDNYDDQTGAFNSWTSYSYYIPVSEITLNLVANLGAEQTDYFEITWGKNQLSFANGEYYNIADNVPLDIGGVYSLIIQLIQAP